MIVDEPRPLRTRIRWWVAKQLDCRPQYLREGAAVRFVVDPDDRNERGWIEAKLRDGRVEVTGGRALNLRPWVTNVVHIDLGDDR